ncbi:MAG TPA: addiction module protein [Thermoanaerobaculia bacterium]|jgi:putative addiction module component (TIGR02574 family)
MARTLRDIREEALQLTPRQRLQLVQDLYASVMTEEEREVEATWLDEAERRYAEWKAGNAKTIPSEKVFARLREKYGREGIRASR